MQTLNDLPLIKLEEISGEVTVCLEKNLVEFKRIDEAPWILKKIVSFANETYFSYKGVIYVPEGHIAMAQSQDPNQRIVAPRKLLPWVYAIKNGSVSSLLSFIRTIFSVNIRSYYFLFEYALLKSHELSDMSDLIATGFISTRRSLLGYKKNPDKVLAVLKHLLDKKVSKTV